MFGSMWVGSALGSPWWNENRGIYGGTEEAWGRDPQDLWQMAATAVYMRGSVCLI